MSPLEQEAIELLRRLCFDRGVILHATCCSDSREEFNKLAEKHNLESLPSKGWKQLGVEVKVTVPKQKGV